MQTATSTRESVRDYYGRVLQSSVDLRTSTCCTAESYDPHVRRILAEIDDEILTRFYGCGSPLPLALHGCAVLDLGCGTGRDVYLASRLVGQDGYVIGVDMTDEQLAIARRHRDPQTRRFGYDFPNVDFRTGFIEDLESVNIEDESIDVVISNCVINLSPDKEAVFREIFRVLKPGGELFFSDVFTDRRLTPEVAADPVLYGECLGGAMYIEDFRRLLAATGCADYRIAASSPIEIEDESLRSRAGNVRFTSHTIRAFKLQLEDRCEDYGQVARYGGTIPEAPHAFGLDNHHFFETGKPVLVCGNTASMLTRTRYAEHFDVTCDTSVHYGLFDCAVEAPSEAAGIGPCC